MNYISKLLLQCKLSEEEQIKKTLKIKNNFFNLKVGGKIICRESFCRILQVSHSTVGKLVENNFPIVEKKKKMKE